MLDDYFPTSKKDLAFANLRASELSFLKLEEISRTLTRFHEEQRELEEIINDRVRLDGKCMAPIGQVAFFNCSMKNVDKLLVKLAAQEDDFYCERTRAQAIEIVRKRRAFCAARVKVAEEDLREKGNERAEILMKLEEIMDEEEEGGKEEKEGRNDRNDNEVKVIHGGDGKRVILTPRDGEIVDVREEDDGTASADEVMQMRSKDEILKDREEREKAKTELDAWLQKIEEMERLESADDENDVDDFGESVDELAEKFDANSSIIEDEERITNAPTNRNTESRRGKVSVGLSSGYMPVIERGFEDPSKSSSSTTTTSGRKEEQTSSDQKRPMSKFKMRQMGYDEEDYW
jgi:prefoldin subunit 5